MIDAARARGCPVVVSGSDATDHPEVYLDAGATAVILGEGEVTLARARRGASRTASSLADVAGRRVPARRRRRRARAPRPFVRDAGRSAASGLGPRRRRALPRRLARRHGYHAMNVATTRGCPFHCNWCAKPIYGQRYAVRSAAERRRRDRVAQARVRARPVVDRRRRVRLAAGWVETRSPRSVEERDARIPFRCLMRADQIDADIVRALAAAGCRMVWMGAESGSQRMLDAMEKGVRVEQIREAARRLQGAGIQVGMFLQFGYPGEDVGGRRGDARARARHVAGRHRRLGVVSAAGHEVLRARARGARRQAELGRLRRSRDDVPRHLRAGVLSRAASRRASRVPHAAARAPGQACRAARPAQLRLPGSPAPRGVGVSPRARCRWRSFELRRLARS